MELLREGTREGRRLSFLPFPSRPNPRSHTAKDHTDDPVLRSTRFAESVDLPETPASAPQATNDESKLYYVEQIKVLKEYELTTLYVDFRHLLEREEVLARAISGQYYR